MKTSKENSVKTSNGNISRLPKGLKFIEGKGITKAINIGCGKGYKAHNELLTTLTLINYDPFIPEVSQVPQRGDAQAVVCNNVLNVIEQYEDVSNLLDLLDSYELPVYITIYEGDRSGNGKPTKLGTYQRNMKSKDYQILSNRGYTFKSGVWFKDNRPVTYMNHYKCERCGSEWTIEDMAILEDDCPTCGLTMTPYSYDETR